MFKKQISIIILILIFILSSFTAISVADIKTEKMNDDNQHLTTLDNSSSLPAYWSWKDMDGIDWTTPAKNQGHFEGCAAFALIGCLESVIKIREGCAKFNPDLSEQYFISFTDPGKINGTVFEFCLPYEAKLVPWSKKFPDWEKYFVPSSSANYTTGVTGEFIKNKLIEHGPLMLSIYVPSYIPFFSTGRLGTWGKHHHNPEDYYSKKVPKLLSTYHWVLLVGWKDDSSILNGGYWIIKNSWGQDWGYDGFFNLEYGSLNSDLGQLVWVDYSPDDFNWPPIGNPKLYGPTKMQANIEYQFNFSSIDPEGDQVYYKFSWGDGTESEWFGPFESGKNVTIKHTWDKKGNYQVRVKAKNENGIESDWMPEYKKPFSTFLEKYPFISGLITYIFKRLQL